MKIKKILKITVIAVVGIFIFFVIVGLLTDEGKKSFEEGKQTAEEKVNQKSSNFEETELTEQSVRSEITDLSIETGAMSGEDIVSVDLIDDMGTEDVPDDKIVFITYKPEALLDEKHLVRKSADTLITVSEKLFKHPKVGLVRVWTQGEFTDPYGQTTTENAVKLGLSRKTAEKINCENFKDLVLVDYNKLLDIADENSIYPAVKKNL